MNYLKALSTVISLTILFCVPAFTAAAELFSSQQQKDAFLTALSKQDARYDPNEKMIRRRFSSPGYHTTLKGGYVHPTRDSLTYAVALLDSGRPDRLERAKDILRKVISLQDRIPNSPTYGIWPWFAEESLDKMSPPDWNWADFLATQLLQVAHDHMNRLPDDLQKLVKDSIIHAAKSIKHRNVGPGYTNIAVMGTYVTLSAGELFDNTELTDYGKNRLKKFYEYTFKEGSFREYNSPTYTVVAINELSRMLRHITDPTSQRLLSELNRSAWYHLARRFHQPTCQWSGPHSRCYDTLLPDTTKAFIQRATNNKINFLPENQAYESLDAHRISAECPQVFFRYFTELTKPRLEIETFSRNDPDKHDIIGTTYLHPDYSLGSVNIGDLWNQRRPILAYWNSASGPVAMRLRCLHDGCDYSSASTFAIQNESQILGAVVFATDRGDTHISLDLLKDATIKAKDLRLRLQFEGDVNDLNIPDDARLNQSIMISSGQVTCNFQIAHAVFDDNPINIRTGRDDSSAWLDIILYEGEQKDISFAGISQAVAIFALSLNAQSENTLPTEPQQSLRALVINPSAPGLVSATWNQMFLTVPFKPMKTSEQNAAAAAGKSGKDPWKSPALVNP
ncbi:MAG: hypothetical protein JW837_06725 [Sedimentisphaerales bacterium]|nr:hypothetical protein [Sedimentisphaerales bacterium]